MEIAPCGAGLKATRPPHGRPRIRLALLSFARLDAGAAKAAAVRAASPGESRPATRTVSATRRLLHDRRGVLELGVAGAELLGVRRQRHRAEHERRRCQSQSEFLHKPSSCLPNADASGS